MMRRVIVVESCGNVHDGEVLRKVICHQKRQQ